MEGEVIAARTMNSLYIWLDIAYLMMLLGVLLWTKRRQAVIAGLIGGALYFAVFAMAFHQLRIYKFRMDMAVAGPRWTYLRMVNLNCCRLVGYCTVVTKLWKSIFANFYYAGHQ